ncbi:MAG: glycosyltransferase family 4 protein [Flavobacteriaceae bacterium]|nr:glycosyltransferase family 4 protein [Flavobacteriaceae bacterium]
MQKRKNLVYLGNKLSKQGRSVTSIETLGKLLEREDYELMYSSSKKNQLLRLFDILYSVCKWRKTADYVIIDTYSTSAFWYAYLSSKLAINYEIKYIPILRGGDLPQRLQKSPKLCKKLFSNAYLNIAPSHYLLEAFQQQGYTNLKYIPNTLEISKYKLRLRKSAQPKLLYVRSFAHIYNPILALKVLKDLLKTYPKATLSMVGPFKDNSIEDCKAYAKEHQLPVTFTGGMSKEAWLAYAQDFDIFINTTNVDNTPVSVMEAMALGLPVVTTNVGGIPYLLQENEAMLVPPDNVDAMLKAIIQLLKSPALVQQLSEGGRKKVETFDWEVVKHKWLEVLD